MRYDLYIVISLKAYIDFYKIIICTLTQFSFGTLSFGLSSGRQSVNPIPFEAIVFCLPLNCEKKKYCKLFKRWIETTKLSSELHQS